jgi:uncharacterized protein (TIGR03435 family)
MRIALGLVLAAGVVWGQKVEFEVASVKAVDPSSDSGVVAGVHIDGSQVHMGRMSLKELIRIAYKVKFYEVVGPEWIASERYDVSAKIPDGVPRDKTADMLLALLEDRFQMKAHREKRETPVYALITLPGGAKMKKVDDGPPTDKAFEVKAQGGAGGVNIAYGPDSYFKFADGKIEGRKLSMTYFVDVLGRFSDKPVVDMTELAGRYDMDVPLSEGDYQAMMIRAALSAGVSLPAPALRLLDNADGSLAFALKPLGLKLDSRKMPIDVVAVDSALRKPTEN